jgi:hypothetical protein
MHGRVAEIQTVAGEWKLLWHLRLAVESKRAKVIESARRGHGCGVFDPEAGGQLRSDRMHDAEREQKTLNTPSTSPQVDPGGYGGGRDSWYGPVLVMR